jgi:hypothetical protein
MPWAAAGAIQPPAARHRTAIDKFLSMVFLLLFLSLC